LLNQRREHQAAEIAIDARWLHLGGLGTYAYHLIAGFAQHGNGFALRGIVNQRNAERIVPFCDRVVIAEASMYSLREQLEIASAAKGADLLHVPHYNAPLLYRGPLLVSIHDVIHITDPEYRRGVRAWFYARPVLNLVARRADHIVTVSEYSKAQIVEQLGVPPSKVTTIYNGVNSQFCYVERGDAFAAVSRALGLTTPYILYVGNLRPHKNVSTLLRAFALLRKREDIPQELLIIGDDARWGHVRREECFRLGIHDTTHFVSHVAQELLPKIYAAADLLVMPSTIEGFGLPVLEAMACGTPVVCSRATSLPEVGGDAVLYFDPASPEELASLIERVVNSSDLRETLRTKGLERAKQFTWEDSARKHVELYGHLLGLN
jgi:glycosyltransferase involved in cell wall biosynthesis